MTAESALEHFHPGIRAWFSERFAEPTSVQAQSWPRIADGRHLLITAPTGSGKTLTAFLWSINNFANGNWNTGNPAGPASRPTSGQTKVLYISPLKALNNDIQRNLITPLRELEENHDFPSVSVMTRSGDTPQGDRQRMLRRPPDILITTPESLALLLTTRKGAMALGQIETVILDEIHSIIDNRRGVQLMTSLERLVELSGEFQRLALSATVRPLSEVAHYVAGFDAAGNPREVDIVDAGMTKKTVFNVRFPEEARLAAENGRKIWDQLAGSFRDRIARNNATLFFTNSRRLAEKITLKINEDQLEPAAYAHHGSLAREIRLEVENRLKAGELKAIVATSSLEMGIDIGHLDEVVMVQSPSSVSSTLQRIGRAGHNVGETSVGTLYPTHARDFLEAAVLACAVAEKDIEPLTPMKNALDVLAQIIISCCAYDAWQVDDLYRLLVRSTPYHDLPHEQFELIIDMLCGRYAGSRVRELKPRLSFDRINGSIKASKGAVFALYSAGGTIPDRGYYKLRHADSSALIGELDEEFVWEASVGQTFSFGTQSWQIQRITHNDVMVRPSAPGAQPPPFWRSEDFNRDYHFSERIGEYLEAADARLAVKDGITMLEELQQERGFDTVAAEELIGYLERQRETTGSSLPHRHHLLIETVRTGPGGYAGPNDISQTVIHTFWGRRVNRPFALALEVAWRDLHDSPIEVHADNDVIVIQTKDHMDPAQLLTLVESRNLHGFLRSSLESSGFFGARFRECAARALLLNRARFNQRLPLWMSRLQSKKLMTAIKGYSDFPILLETWRTCLDDEFDLPALERLLLEIADGVITWTHVRTGTPSPFASAVTFSQISRYMYADDKPEASDASSLSDELIANAIANESLRPRIKVETVEAFVAKRQRTLADYQPGDDQGWIDWVKERILVPEAEVTGDMPVALLCWVADGDRRWLTHPELLWGLSESRLIDESMLPFAPAVVEDPRTDLQFALEILSFYGPMTAGDVESVLPRLPDELMDDEGLVAGRLMEDDEDVYFCDIENFEILLRFQRAARRQTVTAQSASRLAPYIASWQGFNRPASDDSLTDALACLRGYSTHARVWLADLLQARFSGFLDHRLDDAFSHGQLIWYGTGRETISMGYPEDAELLSPPACEGSLASLFTDPRARYSFHQLADSASNALDEFTPSFWEAVWAGEIMSDTLAALRHGVTGNFGALPGAPAGNARRTARRSVRLFTQGVPGSWSLRPAVDTPGDPLTELEDNKERARLILDRYGFACRELANREGSAMRWACLFRALYTMELSGEVLAGYFFEGLSGPQFMTPAGLAVFQHRQLDPDWRKADFWLNACDPASPCGLGIADERLPQRRFQNYLSYLNGDLALVVENQARRLEFFIPPEDPRLSEAAAPLIHLTKRHKRLTVETINSNPARDSAYLPFLAEILQPVKDHKQIYFQSR